MQNSVNLRGNFLLAEESIETRPLGTLPRYKRVQNESFEFKLSIRTFKLPNQTVDDIG